MSDTKTKKKKKKTKLLEGGENYCVCGVQNYPVVKYVLPGLSHLVLFIFGDSIWRMQGEVEVEV